MNFPRTRVALEVYDYPGDLEEISRQMHIAPTTTQEGDPGRSEARRWSIASGVSESRPIEEHIDALLEKIHPHASELRNISTIARCRLSAGLEYTELNPEITFRPDILRKIADLGVELWLDIYNLSED